MPKLYGMYGGKLTPHPHSDTWCWQHCAVGMLFFKIISADGTMDKAKHMRILEEKQFRDLKLEQIQLDGSDQSISMC